MAKYATAWVVGCHYYPSSQKIAIGEVLILKREPHNPYDNNAIAAISRSGKVVGHLSRTDAAIIAPRLDKSMLVPAVVVGTNAIPARLLVSF